jgi:hypothetical protein
MDFIVLAAVVVAFVVYIAYTHNAHVKAIVDAHVATSESLVNAKVEAATAAIKADVAQLKGKLNA